MDKQTLSHYGWIVIVVLVLAVMLAFATPFGTYVGDAVVATTKGFGSITEHNLNEDNIKNQGDKWEDKFENGVGGGTSEPESPTQPEEPIGNKVPEGGTYYVGVTSKTLGDYSGATATYTAGQAFPDTVNDGDVFVYGDYEYRYNQFYAYGDKWYNGEESQNGWGVRVIDTSKTKYEKIACEINNEPITNAAQIFTDCTSLITAPKIPDSVTDMGYTFYNCTSLTTAPTIPSSVTNMKYTFGACTSLTTAPAIPSSVTDMYGTFSDCTSLTTAPAIPSSVTDIGYTFYNCTSLTTAPAIPSSVTDMRYTFGYCTSLTTAPAIPSSVTDMRYTFSGCKSLTGTITINANPTDYADCFRYTVKSITLTGSSTKLSALADTANNGNVTVSRRDHTGGGY